MYYVSLCVYVSMYACRVLYVMSLGPLWLATVGTRLVSPRVHGSFIFFSYCVCEMGLPPILTILFGIHLSSQARNSSLQAFKASALPSESFSKGDKARVPLDREQCISGRKLRRQNPKQMEKFRST